MDIVFTTPTSRLATFLFLLISGSSVIVAFLTYVYIALTRNRQLEALKEKSTN